MLKATRVVHGNRKVLAQPLEQSQLLSWEGIQFTMRGCKDAHQLSVHEQGNGDFGEGCLLAGDVIWILAYVRRVAHFSAGRYVAHQAVLAYF